MIKSILLQNRVLKSTGQIILSWRVIDRFLSKNCLKFVKAPFFISYKLCWWSKLWSWKDLHGLLLGSPCMIKNISALGEYEIPFHAIIIVLVQLLTGTSSNRYEWYEPLSITIRRDIWSNLCSNHSSKWSPVISSW